MSILCNPRITLLMLWSFVVIIWKISQQPCAHSTWQKSLSSTPPMLDLRISSIWIMRLFCTFKHANFSAMIFDPSAYTARIASLVTIQVDPCFSIRSKWSGAAAALRNQQTSCILPSQLIFIQFSCCIFMNQPTCGVCIDVAGIGTKEGPELVARNGMAKRHFCPKGGEGMPE